MILPSFAAFRYGFSAKVTPTISVSIVSGSPDTITRGPGDFDSDGFLEGMALDLSGAANAANLIRRTIATVSSGTLTLNTNATCVSEGPLSCDLVGVMRDTDGYEQWPYSFRAYLGFDGGLVPTIVETAVKLGIFPISLTCNDSALDAVSGVDEYDWYVSQRTDDPALQFWDVSYTIGASGSIVLNLTAYGATELGVTDPLTAPYQLTVEQKQRALNNMHVYCHRKSDKAWQWTDLGKLALS